MDDKTKQVEEENFIPDYREIVPGFDPNKEQFFEWSNPGDGFKKFSLYENDYSPIQTSGSTNMLP